MPSTVIEMLPNVAANAWQTNKKINLCRAKKVKALWNNQRGNFTLWLLTEKVLDVRYFCLNNVLLKTIMDTGYSSISTLASHVMYDIKSI